MKGLILTLLFAITLNTFVKSQYYTQYFDGADTVFDYSVNIQMDTSSTNIWQIAQPMKIIFDSAATFPNAILTDSSKNYPSNNYSTFTIKVLPQAWAWGIWAVQWKQKLDIEKDYDGGMIELTTDQGQTWTNVFNNPFVYNFYGFLPNNHDTLVNFSEPCFSGTDSTWRDVWLCFDISWMSTFPDTLSLRYSFVSDAVNTNQEGWMLDNFISHITFVHTVNEKESPEYIKVYPNPTTDFIHIEAKKMNEFHIIEELDLIDAQGKIVESWKNVPTKFWIDIRKHAIGNYLLRVKSNIQTETIPITITK